MKNIIKAASFFMVSFTVSVDSIDLENLLNYENQDVPEYITKDNTEGNPITDEGATLGRVLFYDKNLSSNNTTACASCHLQMVAFGDTSNVSTGANDLTQRHSMRLINARFSEEVKFFWDERAASLEEQATQPIKDHGEMGFSGTNGDPSFEELINKLDTITYYDTLFELAFGDQNITEVRIQKAIAQFIRSIQSFDSKYDAGRAMVDDHQDDFPNFTNSENQGKNLFSTPAVFNPDGERFAGGAGCIMCHRAPEFDIDPASLSNGVMFGFDGEADIEVTKSPTLRDVLNPDGSLNGPLMHNSNLNSFSFVLFHYNSINDFSNFPGFNEAIDPRLRPNGNPQQLLLTTQERQAIEDFVKTLSGTDVYVNEKWSNPFDESDELEIIGLPVTSLVENDDPVKYQIYPNPARQEIHIKSGLSNGIITFYNYLGQSIFTARNVTNDHTINLEDLPIGIYFLNIIADTGTVLHTEKIVKQ